MISFRESVAEGKLDQFVAVRLELQLEF